MDDAFAAIGFGIPRYPTPPNVARGADGGIELRTASTVWQNRIPGTPTERSVGLDFTPGVRAVQTFPMLLHEGFKFRETPCLVE